MSSARQGLAIVGKAAGNYFFGPIGRIVGAVIGGEIGSLAMPCDCPSDGGKVAAVRRGDRAPANMPADPA